MSRLMQRTEAQASRNQQEVLGPDDLRRYLEAREERTLEGDFSALFALLRTQTERLTPQCLDNWFSSAIPLAQAEETWRRIDAFASFRDLGTISARLSCRLDIWVVEQLVEGGNSVPPLWKFVLRVMQVAGVRND